MDIVERLRQRIALVKFDSDAIALHDAANMIEQLRGQVDFETQCREEAYADLKIQDVEIELLREALRSLIQLNDNYSFFGGELYQDRIEKTWDKARTALKEKE